MDAIKIMLLGIGSLIVLVAIGFALNYAGLESYQFFGPRYEAVRRNTFEQTKSYQDGLRRDFDNLYLSYQSASNPDEKAAIISVMRHRADGVDPSFLPDNVRNLLRSN